jgi:sulfonate transport system substrate-binding protein
VFANHAISTISMKRSLLVVAAVAAIVMAGLVFLRSSEKNALPQKDPKATINVRLNTPFLAVDFAPFFVAKNKGWFDEALSPLGAKPEFQPPLNSIATSNEALGAGRTDMLMTGEIVPIIGKAGGQNVKIIWISAAIDSEIIVPNDSPITNLRQLKGKKISTIAGSGAHYCVLKYLEQVGLGGGDITIVNLMPPDGKAAFETAAVDAWAIFPPWTEEEIIAGKARILQVPEPKAKMRGVLAGSGNFCQQHPTLVNAVVKALDRARKWMIENPEEAQSIVSQEITLPLPVVRMAWPKMDWTDTLNEASITDIQAKADFIKKEGVIRTNIDVRKELLLTNPK